VTILVCVADVSAAAAVVLVCFDIDADAVAGFQTLLSTAETCCNSNNSDLSTGSNDGGLAGQRGRAKKYQEKDPHC
jgi:hypothetical protein